MTAGFPADPAGPTRRRRLRTAIEAHLGSHDVARVIYGAIIGLALVVALQDHPPAAGDVAAILVGTAVAVGLAELYSDLIGTEARTRRPVPRARTRELAAAAAAVAAGAGFPAVFFVLAAVGVMELATAFALAKWSGLALICGYGFVAGRLSGSGIGRALLHAVAVGAVGGALIALKAVLH